ncbi:MAG: nucleotidyltransferase family protein [Clostridia bacterium]|nr:nucleotidyltransferase family protein [Clostridia bacterium]
MLTVAIISEYNLFHKGHEHQIREIRRELGEDTRIIAIMSGNYTQRGQLAVADKFVRAKAALMCGVNLVLELPFPFSMSSAEFFARSAVKIADSIGVVDYLSFGSETGDIDALIRVKKNTERDEFQDRFKAALDAPKSAGVGYAQLCESVYRDCFGKSEVDLTAPNNILALEYVKALSYHKSPIKPHTVKRAGGGYNDELISGEELQSATAIRTILKNDVYSALEYVPENAKNVFLEAYNDKSLPCDESRLDAAVIASFRLNSPGAECDVHDALGGLYNRLRGASFEANSISSLLRLTETKKFTRARIRRAIWYSYFGVTSSDVRALPEYTQLLATDKCGQGILREIKKVGCIPILTKPSATEKLSEAARLQKQLSDRADSVFQLTKNKSVSGNYSLTCTPFVKK